MTPLHPIAGISALAIALTLAAMPAVAVTVTATQSDTAAQAPMGNSSYSRFDTDWLTEATLAQFATGGSSPLFAASHTVEVRYLGTQATREASLSFQGLTLFDTRSGCNFATALVDEFCLIDSIGTARALGDLATGTALDFTLTAQPQLLGSASEQRTSAQSFSSLASARWIDLGGGQYLLGFEEGGDASYNDMLFLVSGATATLPSPALPVSELPTGWLLAAGLAALAWRHHMRR